MNDRTLIDALHRQVRERPSATAFRNGDRILTFVDIENESSRLANALVDLGIEPGDRVACLTKHHIECLLLMLAACKVGAVCMPINWRLAPPEVLQILDHGQAKLFVTDAAFLEGLSGALPKAIRQLVCTDAVAGNVPSLQVWAAHQSDVFEATPAQTTDAAVQLYSSGTTGLPKGIVLSHQGLIQACSVVAEAWGFDETGVLGNPLPAFHIAGVNVMLMTLIAGGPNSVYSDFDPAAFIGSIGAHGITHTFLVPGMIMFMLDSPAAATGNYSTLRLVSYGASPISERVLTDAMRVFDCDFVQAYGLTETSGPVTFLMPGDHRLGGEMLRSAGRPLADTEVRIVDPGTLEDLAEGETGEVWSRSIRNFIEYWRSPEATAAAFPEGRDAKGGWFRTGDGGYMKDGYLFINDRIKDMIISGGENIYPAEIENTLMSHPHVADCAIIGVPDKKWGEAVKACVILKPGSEATGPEIVGWMRERLAGFKCPKSVDFVEALPRNPSGKLLKRLIREPYWKDHERAVH